MVDNSKVMHIGAGRITRLLMHPMSLYESSDSTSEILIMDLFDKKDNEKIHLNHNVHFKILINL